MRKVILSVLIAFGLMYGCKKKQVVDITMLDNYISATDSLQNNFSNTLNYTLNGIYHLIDDSIAADSISKLIILPDTLMFYQFLRFNISEINKISYVIQQELLFAQDQLEGFKDDILDNQISAVQYEMLLESQKEMYDLLKERVDSVAIKLNQIAEQLYLTNTNTVHNDKSE